MSAFSEKLKKGLEEAANNVSAKTRKQFPHLPWKELVGLRNRPIHAF